MNSNSVQFTRTCTGLDQAVVSVKAAALNFSDTLVIVNTAKSNRAFRFHRREQSARVEVGAEVPTLRAATMSFVFCNVGAAEADRLSTRAD